MFPGSTVWVRALRFAWWGSVAMAAWAFGMVSTDPRPPGKEIPRGRSVSFPMAQEQAIEVEGKITSVLAGTMFHVELANKHTVLAHISGKMRKRFIRLTNGDRVKMEMSPYDLTKARIVYRLG